MPLSSIDHLCLMRYVFLGVRRKARRKDKEASAPGEDPKLYLEEAVLERKHGDLDLRTLVELPAGLDYNEWLASHSEYLSFSHPNQSTRRLSLFCMPYFSSLISINFHSATLILWWARANTASEWVGGWAASSYRRLKVVFSLITISFKLMSCPLFVHLPYLFAHYWKVSVKVVNQLN